MLERHFLTKKAPTKSSNLIKNARNQYPVKAGEAGEILACTESFQIVHPFKVVSKRVYSLGTGKPQFCK